MISFILWTLGVFGYLFLGLLFGNLYSNIVNNRCSDFEYFEDFCVSLFFPIALPIILINKFAKFLGNPKNWKFKIKLEKRED